MTPFGQNKCSTVIASLLGCAGITFQIHGLSTFSSDGLVISLFAMIALGGYYSWLRLRQLEARFVLNVVIGVFLVSAIGWGFIYPLTVSVFRANVRLQIQQNMRLVYNAVCAFQDSHKDRRLPELFSRSVKRNKLLSWRVAILPYLGYKSLYDRFRLDEPWDSDNNRALLPFIPECYKYQGSQSGMYATTIQAINDENAAFGCATGCRIPEDFPCGLSNVVWLIEAPIAIPWKMPDEIDLEAMLRWNGRVQRHVAWTLFYRASEEPIVLFGDGSVRDLLSESDTNVSDIEINMATLRQRVLRAYCVKQ